MLRMLTVEVERSFVARWDPIAVRMCQSLVCLGIALRLAPFLARRSLWLDECMLALNIANRRWADLAKPLDYNQGAPFGFLLLEKLAVKIGGCNEYALRAVPLMSGIATMMFMYALARRYLSPFVAVSTLSFVAISPQLIYYSNEAKQYSTDVALSALLLLLATTAYQQRGVGGTMIALYCAGAIGIWLSHPTILVIVAILMAFLFLNHMNTHKWWDGRTALLGCLWIPLVAAVYLANLRNLSGNNVLTGFWSFAYMPWSHSAVHWIVVAAVAMFEDLFGSNISVLAMAIASVGAWALWRDNRKLLVFACFPVGATLCAAALHRYPFSGRLILFLSPCVLLLVASGIAAVGARVPGRSGLVCAALTCVVILPMLVDSWQLVRRPVREEMRSALQNINSRWQPGDGLYLRFGSQMGFKFYQENYRPPMLAGIKPIIGGERIQTLNECRADIDRLEGARRIWVVLPAFPPAVRVDEAQLYTDVLQEMHGSEIERFDVPGVSVLLAKEGRR